MLAVRRSAPPEKAHRLIADALPPAVASILHPEDLEEISERLKTLPQPPARVLPRKEDWVAAMAVFLLVFLSTFPVVIPFLILRNAALALRVSNAVALLMLFIAGFSIGRLTGGRPFLRGAAMVILGGALVALTIALGG